MTLFCREFIMLIKIVSFFEIFTEAIHQSIVVLLGSTQLLLTWLCINYALQIDFKTGLPQGCPGDKINYLIPNEKLKHLRNWAQYDDHN